MMKRTNKIIADELVEYDYSVFDDPDTVKGCWITTLRFLHKHVMPEIDRCVEALPASFELREHPLNSMADVAALFDKLAGIDESSQRIYSKVDNYVSTFRRNFSDQDRRQFNATLLYPLIDAQMKPVIDARLLVSKRVSRFLDRSFVESECEPETAIEQAIYRAGDLDDSGTPFELDALINIV